MPERFNLVNVAVGTCVAGLGIVLLLHSFGVIQLAPLVRYWPVVLVVIGAAVTAQAVLGGTRPAPAPIGLIVLVLLGGFVASHVASMRDASASAPQAGRLNSVTVMGGYHPQPPTGEFTGGQIANVMGGSQIDLRQATIAPGAAADIELFTMMGGVDLRVPDNWQVEADTVFVMGGMDDKRPHADTAQTDPIAPKLILRGSVIMGGITIRP